MKLGFLSYTTQGLRTRPRSRARPLRRLKSHRSRAIRTASSYLVGCLVTTSARSSSQAWASRFARLSRCRFRAAAASRSLRAHSRSVTSASFRRRSSAHCSAAFRSSARDHSEVGEYGQAPPVAKPGVSAAQGHGGGGRSTIEAPPSPFNATPLALRCRLAPSREIHRVG
jgi:hypothetical protein